MTRKLALLTVLAAMAAACGGMTGAPKLTVSARAGESGAAAAALAGGPSALTLADGIAVDRLRMVIRKVEIESDSSGEGAREVELEGGPYLLDLGGHELDGATHTLFQVSVPAGTYDEVRFEIHHLDGGERVGDPDFDSGEASVIVDGTIDGEPFRFVSRVNDTQRHVGTFDLTAPAGEGANATHNVTLNIDPSGWFKGPSGRLDPRDAGQAQAIEDNIFRRSIDVFGDDDHDGEDDDHEGQGGPGSDGSGGSNDDLGDDHGGQR